MGSLFLDLSRHRNMSHPEPRTQAFLTDQKPRLWTTLDLLPFNLVGHSQRVPPPTLLCQGDHHQTNPNPVNDTAVGDAQAIAKISIRIDNSPLQAHNKERRIKGEIA